MANGLEGKTIQGSVPVPDPTLLTTELVSRAIAAFREVVETRLSGLDEATKLAAEKADQLSADTTASRELMRLDIDRAATSLRELIMSQIKNVSDVSAEKFQGIEQRFMERDERTAQATAESRISLDAALSAAKEAVSEQNNANSKAIAKSEESTQKQIDALVQLMTTGNIGLSDKIGDLKGRLDRGEGSDAGAHTKGLDSRTLMFGLTAAAASVVAIIVAIVSNI